MGLGGLWAGTERTERTERTKRTERTERTERTKRTERRRGLRPPVPSRGWGPGRSPTPPHRESSSAPYDLSRPPRSRRHSLRSVPAPRPPLVVVSEKKKGEKTSSLSHTRTTSPRRIRIRIIRIRDDLFLTTRCTRIRSVRRRWGQKLARPVSPPSPRWSSRPRPEAASSGRGAWDS